MESENLERMKPRAQEEEKIVVVGIRKKISSLGEEIYRGRVRRQIIWIKIENTLIKFVHATNLRGVTNMIDNRVKIQEVILECGSDELKQTK